MPATATEGGIRDKRYEYAREVAAGEFIQDPSWNLPSDNVTNFEWSPSGGVSERRGLGTADVVTHHNGPEEHEFTLEYDMQVFPVDSNGDAQSLDGDGLIRKGPQNALPNTHQLVRREQKDGLSPEQTINGSTSRDSRVYTVGLGCKVDSVNYTGDPSGEQPIVVEVTYSAEKGRQIQIDQPSSSTELAITNNGTESVDVTIEDDGAATTETLTVAAGATESTASAYDSVDALQLSKDIDGDVELYEWDSTNSVTEKQLSLIRGSDFYGHGEGDRGTPLLGAGSHASAIGTTYETILDDKLEQPAGSGFAYELNSLELSVENNVQSREQIGTPRMALSADNRAIEFSTTIVGETESVRTAEEHLAVKQNTIVWTLDGGSIEVDNAALTDFSGVADEMGSSAMSLDNTFTGEGLTVTSN